MLNTTCADEYAFIFRLGTALVMSVAVVMFMSVSAADPSAVTEMPTSWMFSSRRCAVTTISSMPDCAVACCACATNGVTASATAELTSEPETRIIPDSKRRTTISNPPRSEIR